MPQKLPLTFYKYETKKVAKELLGKRLVRVYKGKRLSGIIVETGWTSRWYRQLQGGQTLAFEVLSKK